jgi:hypothetical protein
MSWGAILGLVALNLWFTAVGLAVVFGLRGWATWSEFGRLLGLAYIAGVAAVGVATVWQLTLGVDLSVMSVLGLGSALAVVGVSVGVRLEHPCPPRPRRFRLGSGGSLSGAVFAALAVVYLEAQFRAARLAGLYEFDSWAFWVPKAKAIYFFGGLDRQLFHDLPGPSYPPLVPALEAAAFHFMGKPDEVTLHLQFWFLLVGFVWALAGLVAERARALLVWPPILLVLVTPHVVDHALQPQGDLLLDEFFALAAVAVALWFVDRHAFYLPLAALLLAAATLTKREGLVLAACCVIAAALATWRERRTVWLRLALVGLAVLAALSPWRILLATRDLPGGAPEAGGTGLFANADRAWPSLRLALSTVFDFQLWLIVVPVLLLAIAAAFVAGSRQLATYVGALSLLCVAAFTWSTWAFPSLPITRAAALNPIGRFSGALVIAAAGLITVLLAQTRGDAVETRRTGRLVPVTIACALVLAYPLVSLAGGLPRFPDRGECARAPQTGRELEAVFGRFLERGHATAALRRATGLGFKGLAVERDGCGYLRVVLHEIPTLAVGHELVAEAGRVGLHVTLESPAP